ncbi:MAG TPA: hypothetical protein DCE41_26250, partial [Cytophagales bacterium]|nr:hypothetical protein [Cytophagales bacterium]
MASTTYWNQVYTRYAPTMLGVCLRYVSDRATAEDLVQEGFLVAMAKYDGYKGRGSFEGWLRRIMITQALMYLRKQKRRPTDAMEPEAAARIAEATPDETPRTRRTVIEQAAFTEPELMAMLDQLPEHHRAVFNLHIIDGLKHKEIAAMLDISESTSKSHLLRARKKLNEVMYAEAVNREQQERSKVAFWWFILPGSAFPDRWFATLRNWEPAGAGAGAGSSPFAGLPTQVLPAKSILVKQAVGWTPWVTTGLVATTMVVGTMTQTTRNPELTSNVPLADTLQVDSAEAILASSDSLAAQDTLLLAATDSLGAPPA